MTKQSSVEFTAPRANPPICWLCDKTLHAGGRSYVIIQGAQGEHPAHKQCAQGADLEYREPPIKVPKRIGQKIRLSEARTCQPAVDDMKSTTWDILTAPHGLVERKNIPGKDKPFIGRRQKFSVYSHDARGAAIRSPDARQAFGEVAPDQEAVVIGEGRLTIEVTYE